MFVFKLRRELSGVTEREQNDNDRGASFCDDCFSKSPFGWLNSTSVSSNTNERLGLVKAQYVQPQITPDAQRTPRANTISPKTWCIR